MKTPENLLKNNLAGREQQICQTQWFQIAQIVFNVSH
jgi:hypothetical protein